MSRKEILEILHYAKTTSGLCKHFPAGVRPIPTAFLFETAPDLDTVRAFDLMKETMQA